MKAVALGTSWVAAVTSLNFLRIFTLGGLQVHSKHHCTILSIACLIYAVSNYISKLLIILVSYWKNPCYGLNYITEIRSFS